jgi:hypothetical protein
MRVSVWLLGLALCWAQSEIAIRAALEGKGDGPVEVTFRQGSRSIRMPAQIQEGLLHLSWPAHWQGPAEIILSAPGYLPVRYKHPISPGKPHYLDLTDPKSLHEGSSFVLIAGKAHLAAGDLGQLPDETHPIINAYDIELFYLAQKSQDLKADFTGDGRVDEADFALLLKNQNLLLRSVL